ncbi:hypothetical protein [Brevundimonas sp. TWP2-3-2]|uniref:hypothetical protein n=1 Tax=unclassified Brevundimonas TaxID=2622653 RepID=UPI003CF6285F
MLGKAAVSAIVMANVHPATRLHTDESRLYKGADAVFASHETVINRQANTPVATSTPTQPKASSACSRRA